jgi:alpha-galactosidase
MNQHATAIASLILATTTVAFSSAFAQTPPPTTVPALIGAEIRTPKAAATPRINGPRLYGERPARPFLYTIPATGDQPIAFSATGLPDGLTLDHNAGCITGSVTVPGNYAVTLTATNSLGSDTKTLQVRIGEDICLTPPLGWNSWNCFAQTVDQEKVRAMAQVMVNSGLSKHGWTYINIDDTWQGKRPGPLHALQPNNKFPDFKALCDEIHAMGLKAGIYSTPWMTSYANFAGGSAYDQAGDWPPPRPPQLPARPATVAAASPTTGPTARGGRGARGGAPNIGRTVGPFHFQTVDARQFADWGFDYLKYDWNPNRAPDISEMAGALYASGRDIVYSLSNAAPFDTSSEYKTIANAWRTTGDIRDNWQSMSGIGFQQSRWVPNSSQGHFNDPDMLVVGTVGWGPKLHPSQLTPDEQYTHITLWCLLNAPMLIGCDLTKLDDFTYGLLSNDEVIAVDQDFNGHQADRISKQGDQEVWAKPLSDGTWAVGLFNRGTASATVTVKLDDLKMSGPQAVRDLWRQKSLADAGGEFSIQVAPHGAELVKIGSPLTEQQGFNP